MTIAISVSENQRLGHLGEARWFARVEVSPQDRTVIRSQVVEGPPHEPGSFPRWLREQNVQALITAGIGQRALDNLTHHGVEVRIGQAGAPVESVVAAWLAGQLTQMPNGCDHQTVQRRVMNVSFLLIWQINRLKRLVTATSKNEQ